MASTASNSGIDICARALVLIGAEPITSFDDATTEALVAESLYEDVVRANLTQMRWRFATKQAELNRLTALPTARFDSAYQLPTDFLLANALVVGTNLLEYEIYGDKIYTNVSESSTVVLDYIYRADETDWPSFFTLAMQYAMASVFAGSIARDPSLIEMMELKYDIHIRKARSADSQQSTANKLVTSRFITERRS